MKTLPSKDLLSAVLGEGLEIATELKVKGTTIEYFTQGISPNFIWKTINIHELAHMVKEWAYDNYDVTIISTRRSARTNVIEDSNEYYEDTEPEAIFKAGEWILKGISK